MNCGRLFFLAAALLSSVPAGADDLADRLNREFAHLASESASDRDAAMEAIQREGMAAEEPIRTRLSGEKDPEVRGRMKACLDAILVKSWVDGIRNPLWAREPFEDNPVSFALSPDGKLVATGGPDARIRILEAPTLKELATIETGTLIGNPSSVVFSPEGDVVFGIAQSGGCPVRGWTVKTGKEVPPLTIGISGGSLWKNSEGAFAFVEHPEAGWRGDILAVGSAEGISTTTRGSACGVRRLPGWIVRQVASSGGKLVFCLVHLSGRLADAELRVEDAIDPEFPDRVSLDSSAAKLASIRRGHCSVVNFPAGDVTFEFGEFLDCVTAIPDGWVTYENAGVLRWWKDGKETRSVKALTLDRGTLRVAGPLLAIGPGPFVHGDRTARSVEIRRSDTGELVESLADACIEMPTGGDSIVCRYRDGRVAIFAGDRRVGELPKVARGSNEWNSIEHRGQSLLFDGSGDPYLVDLAHASERRPLPPHRGLVFGIEWKNGGLAARAFKTLVLFDDEGRATRTLPTDENDFTGGRFGLAADVGAPEKTLVAASTDGTVCAWIEGGKVRIVAGAKPFELPCPVEDPPAEPGSGACGLAAVSPDGARIAILGPALRQIEVWDVAERHRLFRVEAPQGHLEALAFATDSKHLIFRTEAEGALRLCEYSAWDAAGAKTNPAPLPGQEFAGRRWVALFGPDHLLLTDLLDPKRTRSFDLGAGNPYWGSIIAASQDGEQLLAWESQGEALWSFDIGSGESTRLADLGTTAPPPTTVLSDDVALVLSPEGLLILRGRPWGVVERIPGFSADAITASPDGRRLAILRGSKISVHARR
ncbi:MAG: hypothetical protein FD180_2685 [Planctomycetota bacterium]|nr:MAG: hypothetical protein FD180_2685 [Planctomycetota bacterium]